MKHHSGRIISIMLLLSAAALLLASDSKNANATTPPALAGSCLNSASGFCNEFTGSSYKADRVARSCEQQRMTFLAGECPTGERVGTCLVYKGKDSESYYRYYPRFPGFGMTPAAGVAAEAQRQCTQLQGEWTPN